MAVWGRSSRKHLQEFTRSDETAVPESAPRPHEGHAADQPLRDNPGQSWVCRSSAWVTAPVRSRGCRCSRSAAPRVRYQDPPLRADVPKRADPATIADVLDLDGEPVRIIERNLRRIGARWAGRSLVCRRSEEWAPRPISGQHAGDEPLDDPARQNGRACREGLGQHGPRQTSLEYLVGRWGREPAREVRRLVFVL